MKRVYLIKPTRCDASELAYEIKRHFNLMGKYINVSLHGEPVTVWYSYEEPGAILAVKELIKELQTLKGEEDMDALKPECFILRILAEKINASNQPNIIIVSRQETERIPISMGFHIPALVGGDALLFTKDQCLQIPM